MLVSINLINKFNLKKQISKKTTTQSSHDSDPEKFCSAHNRDQIANWCFKRILVNCIGYLEDATVFYHRDEASLYPMPKSNR